MKYFFVPFLIMMKTIQNHRCFKVNSGNSRLSAQAFFCFWYQRGETLLIFSILNDRKQYKRLMFHAVYKVSMPSAV